MKIMMVITSKHGSTNDIGAVIAAELRDLGHSVDLHNALLPPALDGYDAVILGNAIYAGHWLPEANRFATHYHAELAQRPVWVFSSGPLGSDDPKPHDDPQQLAAALGNLPIRDHKIFVGKLDQSSLNIGERLIAKVVGAPIGDFRDWEAIRAWAHAIAAALPAATPTAA